MRLSTTRAIALNAAVQLVSTDRVGQDGELYVTRTLQMAEAFEQWLNRPSTTATEAPPVRKPAAWFHQAPGAVEASSPLPNIDPPR